jgi:hypothetical protein
MFLREVQSNLENLADMGADVGWLRAWAERKQKQILESDVMPTDVATPAETPKESGIR